MDGNPDAVEGGGIVGVDAELPLFGSGAIGPDENVPGLRLIGDVDFASPGAGHLVAGLQIQALQDGMLRV